MGATNSSLDSDQTTNPADSSPPLEDGMIQNLSSYSISIHPPDPAPSALLTDSAPPTVSYSLADHLSEQVKDLETYRELYLHEVEEMARLRTTVSALQTSLETSMDSLGRLELDLSVHKSREETLMMENQAIKQRISTVQGVRKSTQGERLKRLRKTHTLHLLVTAQQQLMSSALRLWRLNLVEPVGAADLDYGLMVKDLISKANAIVKGITLRGLAWGPALSKYRLISLCDGLFEAKYQKDREDLTYGTAPQALETYIEEYLKLQVGTEQRVWQLLSRLVPGLFRLYQEGDRYGELLSRLFCLFHPRPIPTEVAAFLVKAKADFLKLMQKSDTGQVTLSQAIPSLYALFPSHPNQGRAALLSLQPEALDQDQYSLFVLKQKVTMTGQTAKELFRTVDIRGKGKVDSEDLAQGVCDFLSGWVDPLDLSSLFPASTTSLKDFIALLASPLPDIDVTVESYLVALAAAYDSLIDEQIDHLSTLFADISQGPELPRLDTQKALAKLDPSLTQAQIRSLTLSQSRPLSLSEFQQLVFKGKIAGFGTGPFLLKTAKKQKPPLREKNSFLTPEAKGRKGKEFDFDSASKSRISMSRSSSKGKLHS